MIANTDGERLTAIEERLSYISAMVSEMREELRSVRQMAAENRLLQEQLATARRDIAAVENKLEDMRKSWTGRLWAIATPILAALVASIIALVHEYK